MSIAEQMIKPEAEEVLQEHGFPVGIAPHEPLSVHVLTYSFADVVYDVRAYFSEAEDEYYSFWYEYYAARSDEAIKHLKENEVHLCQMFTVEVE